MSWVFTDVWKLQINELGVAASVSAGTSETKYMTVDERDSAVEADLEDNTAVGSGYTQMYQNTDIDMIAVGVYVLRPEGGILELTPNFVDSNNRGVIQPRFRIDITLAGSDATLTAYMWMRCRPFYSRGEI
jgi:hypothetical protein